MHGKTPPLFRQIVREMEQFNPLDYGPAFAPLLAFDRLRTLDAGKPNAEARAKLNALSVETAFGHAQIVDSNMAACCIAAVWLLHDFLDESHRISQGIETTSGSYWHGIMHRREGDYSNAKYWFRRVGQHEVMNLLASRAIDLASSRGCEHVINDLTSGGKWNPFVFVDLCQAAIRGNISDADLCRHIQQAEWELLFDYCYRAAVGANS